MGILDLFLILEENLSTFTVTYDFTCGFIMGFPGGLESKASACNVGDPSSISEVGRSPGEGSGNPLQYSCLENPKDRGAWEAAVHGSQRLRHDCLYI